VAEQMVRHTNKVVLVALEAVVALIMGLAL
jgi:hypothetical protein